VSFTAKKYLPDTDSLRKELGMQLKTEPGKAVIGKIHPVNYAAVKRMHELLLLKAYSPNTIKTYCNEFSQLLYLLKDMSVDTLTSERLRSYLLYCVTKLKLSENIIHSRMNAVKFYFKQVLHRDKFFFEDMTLSNLLHLDASTSKEFRQQPPRRLRGCLQGGCNRFIYSVFRERFFISALKKDFSLFYS